jgi:hypothetical protein
MQLKQNKDIYPSPAATHPVLKYFCGKKIGDWHVEFDHPIAEVFRINSPPFCQGTIDGRKINLQAKEKGKKKSSSQATNFGTVLGPDIEGLLKKSTPSSFGRGDETVFDENVRKGKEMTPTQISINCSCYSNPIPRRDIQRALFPNATKIRCQFSKMAIYESGGHFDVHRDTVRSHAHQGTLLVEVRSAHRGGDLILEPSNGEAVRWSLSSIPDDLPSDMVRYIAFYTDINHRVEPVESGVRIVLQYDIYVDDKKKDWDDEPGEEFFQNTVPFSSPVSNELTTKLLESLDKEVNNNLSVSFPLLHLYTDTKLLPSRLKFTDHQIFTALLHHGFLVQMVPIEITASASGTSFDDPEYLIQSLSLLNEGYVLDDEGNIIQSKKTLFNVKYIATGFEQLIQMGEEVEHTGNETTPIEYRYFQSVFVVSRKQEVIDLEENEMTTIPTRKRARQPSEEEEEEEEEEENYSGDSN